MTLVSKLSLLSARFFGDCRVPSATFFSAFSATGEEIKQTSVRSKRYSANLKPNLFHTQLPAKGRVFIGLDSTAESAQAFGSSTGIFC